MGAVKAVTDGTFEARCCAARGRSSWSSGPSGARPAASSRRYSTSSPPSRRTLDVVKVNSDENPQAVLRYQVMRVPTLALFSGGELVKQVIGARSKSALLRDFAEFVEPAAAARPGCQ